MLLLLLLAVSASPAVDVVVDFSVLGNEANARASGVLNSFCGGSGHSASNHVKEGGIVTLTRILRVVFDVTSS